MIKRWQDYWFGPVSSSTLGLCRFLFFGWLFCFFVGTHFSNWGLVEDRFYKPVLIFRLLHLPLLSAGIISILSIVWKVAVLFSCIGLFTSTSQTVAFVLGFYLLGLHACFGWVGARTGVVVLSLLILALSRSGDAWSVDFWIRHRKSFDREAKSGEYLWPIRLIRILAVITVSSAVIMKMINSGFSWASTKTLAFYLTSAQIPPGFDGPHGVAPVTWGLLIARHSWLCHFLAFGVLLMEASYILVLFSRTVRLIVVPAFFISIFAFGLILGAPVIIFFVPIHLFWFPWERWRARVVKFLSDRFDEPYEHSSAPEAKSG